MIQYLETCSPIFHSVSCWRSQAGTFLKKKKKTKDEIIQKGKMDSLYWRKLGWVGWVGDLLSSKEAWHLFDISPIWTVNLFSLKFKKGVVPIWHITRVWTVNLLSQVQKRRGVYLTYHQSEQWIYSLSHSKEEWCYLTHHQSLNSEFIISQVQKRNGVIW